MKTELKRGMVVRIDPRHGDHYYCGKHVMLTEPDTDVKGRWRGIVLDPHFPDEHVSTSVRVHNMVGPEPAQQPWRRVRTTMRPGSSEYIHVGYVSGDFKQSMILAGCRTFVGAAQARKHWGRRMRSFLTLEQNKRTNAWSLAFTRKVEARRRELLAAKKVRKAKAAR